MTDHFHSLFEAEKEGFEPSRLLQPTGVRSRTLQPLGYFSSMQQNDFCNISILAEKRSICKQKFEFSQFSHSGLSVQNNACMVLNVHTAMD